jgi:hypothetical protein
MDGLAAAGSTFIHAAVPMPHPSTKLPHPSTKLELSRLTRSKVSTVCPGRFCLVPSDVHPDGHPFLTHSQISTSPVDLIER